ncbi:VOC family protein [Desulfospira joergensenii]|uniref:VOC family protein n=1 Tax=Desulfospira joergensenii TaxID=53329 RepID=UPI0003B41887|nr:VOC family protein [Desulfospira joergensenii]
MKIQTKRLGEIVLRSDNPKKMVEFYRQVIGLELFASFGSANFLKIDDDFEGHPQLLAIFDRTHEYSGPENMQKNKADSGSGTLHHFAFSLDKAAFKKERNRLESMGIEFHSGEHPPFGWRSIYLYDPDGNSVELVCYEADLFDPVLNQRVQPTV